MHIKLSVRLILEIESSRWDGPPAATESPTATAAGAAAATTAPLIDNDAAVTMDGRTKESFT